MSQGRQRGSIYVGDQKLPIQVPRVRDRETRAEVPLETYARLQHPRAADEGILRRLLYGLSCRDYRACTEAVPEAFGLNRSSVSRRYPNFRSLPVAEGFFGGPLPRQWQRERAGLAGHIYRLIEICLRAVKRGYRVLYTPFARVLHHESASRGQCSPPGDTRRAIEHMAELVESGDPYFNPNLSYESPGPTLLSVGDRTPAALLKYLIEHTPRAR